MDTKNITVKGDGTVYILEIAGDKDYKPEKLTVKDIRDRYIDLEGAIPLLRIRYKQYARRIVVSGRINSVKLAIKGSVKWFVEKASITKYVETRSRNTGVRSYKLYIPEKYEAEVRKAIEAVGKERGFTPRFERAYKSSSS